MRAQNFRTLKFGYVVFLHDVCIEKTHLFHHSVVAYIGFVICRGQPCDEYCLSNNRNDIGIRSNNVAILKLHIINVREWNWNHINDNIRYIIIIRCVSNLIVYLKTRTIISSFRMLNWRLILMQCMRGTSDKVAIKKKWEPLQLI